MSSPMTAIPLRRNPCRLRDRIVACLAVALTLGLSAPVTATAAEPELGIGDPGLPETRNVIDIAPGVTLTRIDRGLPLDDPDDIRTTTTGPWVVNVLSIDPSVAKGRMVVADGPTIAETETVQDIAQYAGALAAINSSFFTFTGDADYPGDAGGLAIRGGKVISEPSLTQEREVDLIFNSQTNRMQITKTTWTGTLTMPGTTLHLERLNHRPSVPEACEDLEDQTACAEDGDTVRFDDRFSAATPPGHGVEVVFDAKGCVVSTHDTRGLALSAGQTSVQATGSDAKTLAALGEAGGCGTWKDRVVDEDGHAIPLTSHTWAVTGRVPLLKDGVSVVPPADQIPEDGMDFFLRHPRTFVGQTADGVWKLVVVDGRSTTSVGSSMWESAQIARDLGMVDAINLDGGGSTTMVANGELVNLPQGETTQRKVGDAMAWLPAG